MVKATDTKAQRKKEIFDNWERMKKGACSMPGYEDEFSSYTSDPDNPYRRPEDRFRDLPNVQSN
jgi:hypothetical protein